ncbi:Hsp20/alpha crystallin family protein [Natronorubrum daqingense]|uniref:Hsp20/alpha crystallin family protein n=1 Tax=Natronorubrum daqingense TaxID=588898 RepID=A0A1N6ZAM8_9EURY|nr:Hsp20/alpha crystallin family protein [Natronorubrum daqingense]APX95408.1 molecular chaperone Hsp20 [Natronorubrum daqingense]SIR23847.1 Hsp20/alpha crystallin family protein [Natronorubrum daqingense]
MPALRDALGDLSEDVFFDLLESDDDYLLVLDVPGVSAELLDLTVENGRISIDAHREKPTDDHYHYLEENRSLFFDVDLPVPEDVLETEATATVERGVLELTLPKRSGGGETTIDVVDQDEDEDK